MNHNTSILLNILEAEDRIAPEKLEDFSRLKREYTLTRGAVFTGILSLGSILSFPLVNGLKLKNRKSGLKISGPLAGIAIASYYLSTSLDYFVSQLYFGKILKTVRIDEDIYRLI